VAETEHLKAIQAVIDRMARNSFALKGWTVTVAAALLGFASKDSDRSFALLAIYVVVAMGGLDAYYLALERAYRALFNEARGGDLNWKMAVAPPSLSRVLRAVASPSVWVLHGSVVLISLIVLIAAD
jgi:hypothetical protein